jgi:hypothetical protein
MVTLQTVRRTTWLGVSQFEGVATDGRPVFVHFKAGWLRIWVGDSKDPASRAINGTLIFDGDQGDQHEFDIVWNEVEALTGIKCIGPAEDKYQ